MHLHANVVCFARPPKRTAYSIPTPVNPGTSSFASVLKGNHMPPYTSPSPAIVMEDACVVQEDKEHKSSDVHNTKVSLNNDGSILDALDDMIKLGQIMGYDMDGCVKDME
nr:hypothetical protein [Tanacetum cinerariifolium]